MHSGLLRSLSYEDLVSSVAMPQQSSIWHPVMLGLSARRMVRSGHRGSSNDVHQLLLFTCYDLQEAWKLVNDFPR